MSQTISYIDSALGLNEDPQTLLRKLFWTGLLCLTLLLILATYGVYRAYSWRLIESAHAEAKATCQVLLVKEKKHLFSMDERGQARLKLENSEQASFEKRLQKYFQPLGIDSVKIWDLHRQAVNLTEDKNTHLMGAIPTALDQALGGQGVSVLGKANAVDLKGQEGGRAANQVISYLPIWGRNKEILGAIEIRRSVESYRGEIRRGVTFFALLLGSALLALLGCVFFLVSKSANRLAKTQQVLRSLATTDSLTGLYNRREILAIASDHFSKEQENKRHKTPINFGLLMLDFDNFKEINDTYGHPVGDQVLQVLATRIRAAVRPYDIIGRVGGEEFLVVLPDSSLEQCQEIAERLCKTVRENPFLISVELQPV